MVGLEILSILLLYFPFDSGGKAAVAALSNERNCCSNNAEEERKALETLLKMMTEKAK